MRDVTRAQKTRLGFFLVISGGVLVILILIVTGTKLLERWDTYTVRYVDLSVSGLEIGAQVKYHGVRVGRVDKIFIDQQEIETIVVVLALKGGTPVKTDVEAEITSLSLTGLKIIELTGGTSEANILPPDSEIPAGESPFQSITGKAEAVSEKLELVLTNLVVLTGGENRERLFQLIDNTALVLDDFHNMLLDNRDPLNNSMKNLEIATANIRDITECPEVMRTLANFDSISTDIKNADIAVAVHSLTEALSVAQTTFNHVDLTLLKGRHDLLTSLEVLRESLESFNEFSRLISEDPSLLLRGTREKEIRIGGN